MNAGSGDREWMGRLAPSLDDLEALGRAALAALPEEVRGLIGEVGIRVAEFPDGDALEELEIESEFDLLGLFQGVGLAHAPATPETGRRIPPCAACSRARAGPPPSS